MKAALLQITSSDIPADNVAMVQEMARRAAGEGAGFVLTPEVTHCLSASRTHQSDVLHLEQDDPSLKAFQTLAAELGVWLSIGSMAVKTGDADGRFANRSFLISPNAEIVARYDKIHMFDVTVSETETYHESKGYRPGTRAVVAETPFAALGLSICYDLRFAYLYRALAQAGAQVLLIPSAFSPVTGAAHWESLLRARAIETGCYVLASAQTGTHPTSRGKQRRTYGHTMAVAPWGEVLVDGGTEPGIHMVDLDLSAVSKARQKIAALDHDRVFEGP